MNIDSIIKKTNLELAWRRINTGRNIYYKRFFRDAYLAYEMALEENLTFLHDSLKSEGWEPSYATKIFFPKPSGLQRPVSLLNIEDQIVLQAIANGFADKLFNKRKKIERKSTFSNLFGDKKSIFFLQPWQVGYNAFQQVSKDTYNSGFNWVAHFDLAAYYDTISHDLLWSIIDVKNHYAETGEKIKTWFGVWSATNKNTITGHGIPQGPVASAFLGESFLIPVDRELQKDQKSNRYFRYVDDIRLFGKNETSVQEMAILLEQECRNRGLIPQSNKFNVHRASSYKEAMGSLPSIPPEDKSDIRFTLKLTPKKARKILMSAVSGRPMKVQDKTQFRYVMYRAPKDPKILQLAIKLLSRHPEHIDAFVSYFEKYDKSKPIATAALKCLQSKIPYSYIRGELWHLVARLGNTGHMREGIDMARKDAKKRSRCVGLSWGVMHFLLICEKHGLVKKSERLKTENPISRSWLAPVIDDKYFIDAGIAKDMLRGDIFEQLAAAKEMQKRNISLYKIASRIKGFPHISQNVLRGLGVIRARRLPETDKIAEILECEFHCAPKPIWKDLLGAKYGHALMILREAVTCLKNGKYTDWLSRQDSFNDIVTKQVCIILGYDTVNCRGREFTLGNLLNGRLAQNYPNIANPLNTIHRRRNNLPSSHPYNARREKTVWLSNKIEVNLLMQNLKNAVSEIQALMIPPSM